ncbi:MULTISPECIES: thiolase family protein [unclassified Sulfitobacter]|jgi:acetyl-CoA C-acetyltransferase|uniref:thiolase family protein n=1 Tax=unclassified Sulfitobacter TaxID=196795 RepID=UPI000C565302|nr:MULTISPECIES: acetyl-CoA C-acyltransferase [unclassified Sulfitobacter]AYE85002.1 acetyl-CoA acetyltransferase [Sulfitobacter sp. D7]MAP15648.1 acetyl-CoA C-acyltransferase [Sulfitobacter sp.]MBD83497.1 acetyl-CoA C-acyltransferase [Sulfitobacter sp.]HCQ57883.1 acetyl-CoA C-acetyltransferase [Sulfitobacter sp.]|tara:strand:+ start:76 stop:1248 length:1173 start_codon:yes stop_codon:yes gene_type:complete
MRNVVITGAARTPMGGFQGAFQGLTAAELGGSAIKAALGTTDPAEVQELLMGCVLPAGQGQAPARQAGFKAGLGEEVPATTLNKMCGSGMKAAMMAFDQIALGHTDVMVAGGMESMTNAPYVLPKMRGGARLGHGQVIDHMFLDGLEDAYDKGRLMGTFAEDCAERFQFTRETQDNYALASLSRAIEAQEGGAFADEIAPVEVTSRKGSTTVGADEQPASARPEKIPQLKPAFREGGTVTAANSSSISDGAAALVLADEETAKTRGQTIRARIVGHASHAQAPGLFTTAPVPAAQKLLERIGWKKEDVDLWEVNEAFAVVPLAFMHEMDLSHDIVNVNGGACALGHPIGASGARIMVTLLNALEKRGLKRGVAAICIGGGEGTAIAIERP